jgi:hypothetical protein
LTAITGFLSAITPQSKVKERKINQRKLFLFCVSSSEAGHREGVWRMMRRGDMKFFFEA